MILLVAVVVLIVKVFALQHDVAALRGQASALSTVDPSVNSNELATCRMLGALAAKSQVTLESLFPWPTTSACEAAATEGYHQALSYG